MKQCAHFLGIAMMLWIGLMQPMQAQPKPTIEQYAECLFECVMKELTDKSSPLIFVAEKNIGFKRELDLRLQAFLLSRGIITRESSLEGMQELQYEIQSATVSVEEINGRYLRKASLAVFIKQVHSGELKSAKLISAERIDSLSYDDLERLNDARYPETTLTQRRTWLEKIIVPTLTTLSFGVIVYLFFSVRSN